MGKYAFLLADADNTLFDFPAGEQAALHQVLTEYALPTDAATLAAYDHINVALWAALERGEISSAALRVLRFERLLTHLQRAGDASALSTRYLEALGEHPILLPGAESAVRRWAARVPIAIVTNGISLAQRARIAHSTISGCIHSLLISEEVGAPKPDPRMVYAALEALGCREPAHALLLGDSLFADIGAAHNAGIDSCWFNPAGIRSTTGTPPTYAISSLDEVDALLI